MNMPGKNLCRESKNFLIFRYFPEGAQVHLVITTQWNNRCEQLKALKGVNGGRLMCKEIM